MGTGHYILPSSFLSILSILSALALFFFLDFFLSILWSILSSAILSDDILSPAVLSLAILSSGILSWARPGTAARLASIPRLNTLMIIRFRISSPLDDLRFCIQIQLPVIECHHRTELFPYEEFCVLFCACRSH